MSAPGPEGNYRNSLGATTSGNDINGIKQNNMLSNMAATAAAACGRPIIDPYSYKTMTSLSQNNLAILAKIVKSLKLRFLDGDSEPLTLDEIFDEISQPDAISSKQRIWLENEALEQNVRINVIRPEAGQNAPTKYQFKPLLNIKDRKLRKFLEKQYQSGQGGILLDDIQESMPKANEAVRYLVKNELIVIVQRHVDKKKLVFYNEGKQDMKMDEEFLKLWRSVSVEGVAEDKIEEYLEKHGIKSIQDLASRKLEPVQKRRKTRKQNKNYKSHNEHMKDILQDYSGRN